MDKFNHILEIETKEWFDKVNGNSHFSSRVYYDEKLIAVLPFQYGYGSHSEDMAYKCIIKGNLIRGVGVYAKKNKSTCLYQFCNDKKIKLIVNKQENCLKRDVVLWGEK